MNIHRFQVPILLVLSNFSCLLVTDAVNGGREAGSNNSNNSSVVTEGRYSCIPGACQLEKSYFLIGASEYSEGLTMI